ncbi:MAG TPA: CDP-glycerol glycerophosphotransferase family protein [Candidatus Cloacimonadota bacterium]|nr:CDP-glycerol glycerophosphotransferase family protein [Candidatus Cloacimonadota bacterium]
MFGYLDPGTGAALINLLIAGVATLIYSLKGFIFSLFSKGHNKVKKTSSEKTLAILSEGKMYHTTFEPIIKSLIDAKIEFNYYTLDVEDPALLIDNDYMHSEFLGYGHWASIKAGNIKADYLLCTTPNIGSKGYPIRRSPRVECLVHVFHSINDLSMYRVGSLDHYDMVIQVGDFQTASIRALEKKRRLKEKRLVTLGIPYLDLYSLGKTEVPLEKQGIAVLIGSSWGKKGLLSYYGTNFIKDIAEKGYQITIRPHPQSMATEQGFISKCRAELEQYKNVTWDTDPNPITAMNQADLLISDTSSLRFDFAFVYEKPVITMEIPEQAMPGYEREELPGIWASTIEQEIGLYLKEADVSQISDYIERAMAEYSPERIRKIRSTTVVNYAQCGPAIAEFFALELRLKENTSA